MKCLLYFPSGFCKSICVFHIAGHCSQPKRTKTIRGFWRFKPVSSGLQAEICTYLATSCHKGATTQKQNLGINIAKLSFNLLDQEAWCCFWLSCSNIKVYSIWALILLSLFFKLPRQLLFSWEKQACIHQHVLKSWITLEGQMQFTDWSSQKVASFWNDTCCHFI